MTTTLHDAPTKVLASDFALINAILHTALRVPDMDKHSTRLIEIFSEARTCLYGATLYSWSDRLAALTANDPVYAEAALELLLELSCAPALAETLVISGCLSQLATSTLSSLLQRPGGVGPFAEPARIFRLWTQRILPLAANLLGAIGPLVAADVAAFLNRFGGQLERASGCLDPKAGGVQDRFAGLVTLGMAQEAASLALIADVLAACRDAGPSAGVVAAEIPQLAWDGGRVKGDLEERLGSRGGLREMIVPLDAREERWSRMKASGRDPELEAESALEEKVVEQLLVALAVLGRGEG